MSIYGQYDLRGILGDQTGEDFIEKKKTTKVFLAEIEEVIPNLNNRFNTDPEGIDLLAKSILWKLYVEGSTQEIVAVEYGVGKRTIQRWVKQWLDQEFKPV